MEQALAQAIERSRPEIEGLLRDACAGRHEKMGPRLAGLLTAIFSGIPGIGGIVSEGLAWAFSSRAAEALEQQRVLWNAEQDQTRLVRRMAEAFEHLLGEMHIQLVHSQQASVGEVVAAVHAIHHDLAAVLARLNGPPPRSTLPNAGQATFVGRRDTLAALDQKMDGPGGRLAVVHGPPGTGKSWVALHWARTNRQRYPGGTFYVNMASAAGPPIDLVRLASDWSGGFAGNGISHEDACRAVLARLGRQRTLLIFDQTRDEETLIPWLPAVGLLCDVIATSNRSAWTDRFDRIPLALLTANEAREFLQTLLPPEVLRAHGDDLIRSAGGLAVQLVPVARALARRIGHGWKGDVKQALATETRRSFSSVWALLTGATQTALQAATLFDSQRIPRVLLHDLITAHGNLSSEQAIEALDAAMDDGLLESAGDELRMHELVAAFVIEERARATLVPPALEHAHLDRFARAIGDVLAHPLDPRAARALLQFPLSRDRWMAHPAWPGHPALEEMQVAVALRALGRFGEALPWAIAQAEAANGARDVSTALSYLVGECLSGQAQWAPAETWFRRALDDARLAAAAVHEDPEAMTETISACLHSIGYTILHRGRHTDALPWFIEAVTGRRPARNASAAAAKSYATSIHEVGICLMEGDHPEEALPYLHEALAFEQALVPPDGEDVGRTFHAIGHCHDQVGRAEEAITWLASAVEAKRSGDRFGRVDHDSIARSLTRLAMIHFGCGHDGKGHALLDEGAAEFQRGDRQGVVDHEAFARNRQGKGKVLLQGGVVDEALASLQQALAAHARGDAFGRRDPQSRGRTLHWMGIYRAWRGDFEGALGALMEALSEKRQGDVDRMVDRMSLAWTLYAIGSCHLERRRAAAALPYLQEGLGEAESARQAGQTDDDATNDLVRALARGQQMLASQVSPGRR